jgi:hypothetical protein
MIVAVAGLCGISYAADDQDYEQKLSDIRRLMDLSGELNMTRSAMMTVLNRMQGEGAKLPEGYVGEFEKVLMTDELPERLVQVYDRHYSHSEILELIKFYESPIGKTFASQQPAIQAESMKIGQLWASEVSEEIMSKLLPMKEGAGGKSPTE